MVLGTVFVVLLWPAAASADHVRTSARVSAVLEARHSEDVWLVEIAWSSDCTGAAPGTAWFEGDLYLIDADTGERIYTGAVTSTSGAAQFSGTREWQVAARERPVRLFPELTIHCYENFPLHGGTQVTATGSSVLIPPSFAGRGGGGGGFGGGGSGSGDPTAPLASGGCGPVLMGTSGPDRLDGGDAGEVIFGLGGRDRLDAGDGHDCVLGNAGADILLGGAGSDRLTGGGGADVLSGGPGVNRYDAGAGRDVVFARNRRRELVRCGAGRDRAVVDRTDRVRSCERVLRPR